MAISSAVLYCILHTAYCLSELHLGMIQIMFVYFSRIWQRWWDVAALHSYCCWWKVCTLLLLGSYFIVLGSLLFSVLCSLMRPLRTLFCKVLKWFKIGCLRRWHQGSNVKVGGYQGRKIFYASIDWIVCWEIINNAGIDETYKATAYLYLTILKAL